MKRFYKETHANYYILKPKILAAFKSMRKIGYIARSNHLCCGSCASYSVGEDAKKTNKVGGVYWHSQDEENFKETGKVYVGFTGHSTVSEEDILEIANSLCKELTKLGVPYEWNGSVNTRILVG